MLEFDVVAFLATRRVIVTEDGDTLLTRDDALKLLTNLLQSGGPLPAYVDVYSKGVNGELQFEEDLTMRDLHVSGLGRGEYWANVVAYLSAYGPESLVSPNDFSYR